MASPHSYAFPFNLPFPPPPPPPQDPSHHPPSTPSAASSDPQHHVSTTTQSFHYNGGLPGLSMQSFAPPAHLNQNQNQNQNQYPAYWPPPATAPQASYPAVPPPLPFLTSNGYPIPPLPPNGGFVPPLPIPPPAHIAAMNPTTFQSSPSASSNPHTATAVPDRVLEVADSEKEEGEVSESDGVPRLSSAASHTTSRDKSLLRSTPRVSRNTPHSSYNYPPEDGPSTDGTYHPTPSIQPRSIPQAVVNLEQNREQGKEFVSFLHENNIGYDVLAKEQLDLDLLGDMYRSLRLSMQKIHGAQNTGSSGPVQQAAVAPEKSAPNEAITVSTQPKPPPAVKTNIATNPPAKTAPSPIDRKDYIARLQAAKAAKQAVKSTTSQETPPSADTAVKSTTQSSQAASHIANNVVNGTDKTEEERIRKNELLKQRLAKLTAQHRKEASRSATPQAVSTKSSTALSKPQGTSNLLAESRDVQAPSTQSAKSDRPTLTQGPPFTGIPGLFMNPPSHIAPAPAPVPSPSPASAPGPPSVPQRVAEHPISSSQSTAKTGTRKRPVASDFDDITTSRPGPVYTRPLGQSPHEHDSESMIIEVSDDDGSDMDLDDDNGANEPPSVLSPPASTRPGQQILRNLPPVGDFSSRPGSARPTSTALSTPPAARTQSDAIAYQAEQLRKDTELLNLKLKIAEMTRKRKEKEALAKALGSSPAPQKPVAPLVPNGTDHAKKIAFTLPSSPPTENVSVKRNSSLENSRISSNTGDGQDAQKRKRERRVELQAKLRLLDDGLQKEQDRLEQLQKEIDELKAKSEKAQKDRQELIQELESLGIDTEGMGDEDLRAKKVEIVQQLKSNVVAPQDQTASVPMDTVISTRSGLIQTNGGADMTTDPQAPLAVNPPQPSLTSDTEAPSVMEGLESGTIAAPGIQSSTRPHDQRQSSCDAQAATSFNSQVPAGMSSQASTSEPVVNVTRAEGGEVSTPVDDGEDFYSPEAVIDPTQASPKVNVASPSEEGEVEMSESSLEDEEEDYEPAEETQPYPVSTQRESVQPQSRSASSTSSSMSSSDEDDEDEEAYEPPDVEHQKMDMSTRGRVAPPVSDERDGRDYGAMDVSASPDGAQSTQQASSERVMTPAVPLHNGANFSTQPPSLPIQSPSSSSAPVPATDTELVPDSARFKPYDSPLKMFKSYRYHPNFTQEVSGGFLSMTYSHQIDPQKPLCRFESMGGSCNDPQCPDQHFRTMNLTGEKVLVELGTANPGKTAEERQKWNDGLRSVLKELRQNNIKDPNGIAVEIARFRRQFFNDDFRVVTV